MLSLPKISRKIRQQENKAAFCTQNLETRSKYPQVSLTTRLWQGLRTLHRFVKQRKQKERSLLTPFTRQTKQKVALRKFSS